MQVTQIGELSTNAVIGGGVAHAATISDSVEFIGILSAGIYSNPTLAMVREVLCNAWDAHILAGKTDTPIQIELTGTEFKVTDFGPGLSRAAIGPVYLTYGGSTKKKDKRQTGGFGLGAKSPWSFTDFFTVSSCHANDGERVIYTAIKSDPALEGRPSLKPMTSFPCDETGITVTVPLNSDDVWELRQYIKSVVYWGDIPATLNGESLERAEFEKAETHFAITRPYAAWQKDESIVVKVGNVVYPLNRRPAYNTAYDRLTNFISGSTTFVLFAEPGAVAITPSRETLNYTEETDTYLAGLLNSAIRTLTAQPSVRTLKKLFAKEGFDGKQSLYELARDIRYSWAPRTSENFVFSLAAMRLMFSRHAGRLSDTKIAAILRHHVRGLGRHAYRFDERSPDHRLLARFMTKLDLLGDLRVQCQDRRLTINSAQDAPKIIWIYPTVTDLREHVGYHSRSLAIPASALTGTKGLEFKAGAEKLGYEVIQIERSASLVAKKKKRANINQVTKTQGYVSAVELLDKRPDAYERQLFEPKYVHFVNNRKGEMERADWLSLVRSLDPEALSQTAVVTSDTAYWHLTKEKKAKELFAHIRDSIPAFVKKDKALQHVLGAFAANGTGTSWGNFHITNLQGLLCRSLDTLLTLFPSKIERERLETAYTLIKDLVQHYGSNEYGKLRQLLLTQPTKIAHFDLGFLDYLNISRIRHNYGSDDVVLPLIKMARKLYEARKV